MFLLSRWNWRKHCKAIGQDIEINKQRLKIKFVLAGWIENPIKSKVLTFPIDKIVFPTVTLCPQDSRPDRWGTAIKIFDQLNTDCGSKRWDPVFKLKANEIMLNSLQRSKKLWFNSFFRLRAILKLFNDCQFETLSPCLSFYQIALRWLRFGCKKANRETTSLIHSIFTS